MAVYTVKVIRTYRSESVEIDVDAASPDEARRIALEEVEEDPLMHFDETPAPEFSIDEKAGVHLMK